MILLTNADKKKLDLIDDIISLSSIDDIVSDFGQNIVYESLKDDNSKSINGIFHKILKEFEYIDFNKTQYLYTIDQLEKRVKILEDTIKRLDNSHAFQYFSSERMNKGFY